MKASIEDDHASLSLVVPCYNEEESIPILHERLMPLLDELKGERELELVFVDDGSVDGTYQCVQSLFGGLVGVKVIFPRHERNLGLGAAHRTGFQAASGAIISVLDCDCSYDPRELLAFVELIESSRADIVTASPYHPNGSCEGARPWRIFLSRAANWMYSRILPLRLYCYTSMFRAYRREFARPEWIRSDGFLGVTEILVKAILEGARVLEHPATLRGRAGGKSKMAIFRTMLQHIRLMTRIVFSSF